MSYEDDDQIITDLVHESAERGFTLRTISINSNAIPFAIFVSQTSTADNIGLNIILEQQDQEDGALLESVDVLVSFTDRSENQGDSSSAITEEVLLRTLSVDDYENDPFGLPRINFNNKAVEKLNSLNLSPENIFGGDKFTIRLILKLTDGREYSSDNAGGIITAGFSNSPFRYSTIMVCEVPEELFVGNYLIEEFTPLEEGSTLANNTAVEVVAGEIDNTIRQFATPKYPDFCTSLNNFTLQLFCGEIIVPIQNNICAGSSGTEFFWLAYTVENYIVTDDTVFLVSFLNDVENHYDSSAVTTYRFTKQQETIIIY